ncbi:LysM peptidoglycan-binding domain-containing protein [Aliikangiella marina]|uniref:LysM peptidoglycan-binding domain-containing protein n=1 Tax=Aliikangiella marina TaxID=1712262 RepID=A0A545T747_9GAMM|nr:LysM domain-containing protein [Aliikangiella marina]TQV73054.1 LysM peptidoglycan-binding domain-containing protein [Aliikangiella marina]
MRLNSLKFLLCSLFVLVVSGCQLTPKTGQQARVDDLSLKSVTRQNEQINAAIHLLETGDTGTATIMIDQVLSHNPDHPTAKMLKQQLTQPAAKIFKTNRTTQYKVKQGDTLGKIAQDWLGNSLYFVSIAKLNNIRRPNALQPGKTITIPVTEKSNLVTKERRRSAANINLIRQYREDKRFYKGLDKSNTLFVIDSDIEKLFHEQQLILDALAERSVSLSDRGAMLKRVTEFSENSRNGQQRALYQRFINAQNRLLFLDEAVLLFEDESYSEAATRLINAKKIDAKVDKETQVFRIEKQLLNKLHEQAVVLYRNHALKDALDRWGLILQLDPENQLAQKYSERTNKLLKKLNQY